VAGGPVSTVCESNRDPRGPGVQSCISDGTRETGGGLSFRPPPRRAPPRRAGPSDGPSPACCG
jgi:hypothetical protein